MSDTKTCYKCKVVLLICLSLLVLMQDAGRNLRDADEPMQRAGVARLGTHCSECRLVGNNGDLRTSIVRNVWEVQPHCTIARSSKYTKHENCQEYLRMQHGASKAGAAGIVYE